MKKNEFCNHQPLLPMNVQFFAEGDAPSAETSTPPENNTQETTEEAESGESIPTGKTYEDAMSEIAAARAEAKKAKAERDSALKRVADATKQLRAKMSEDEFNAEQAAQEKAEHDAYVKDLETFQKRTLARERYLKTFGKDLTDLKLVTELSEKAAEAEISGDMDALADIYSLHTQAIRKQDKVSLMGERGRVNIGDGEGSTMTKDEILAIPDRTERIQAIAAHRYLFDNQND